MIRSKLKYLIGAKIVNLKYRVFGGKTGPMAMVRVFGVVRPVGTVRFRVEPYPEPTREFGTVANTTGDCIINNDSFCQNHPGVPDGSDGSDGTLYPLRENYTLPVAQATGHIA
jgi:hypothetical protein